MLLTLEQIRFCANECYLQQSGERSVANMCEALLWALECEGPLGLPLTQAFIRRLGQKIEPEKNENGFRTHNVYFSNDPTKQALNYTGIEQALNSLLRHGDQLTPDQKYIEFQKIHPFLDGNGRVGAILYNVFWIGGGNRQFPIIPPDFFGENRNKEVVVTRH